MNEGNSNEYKFYFIAKGGDLQIKLFFPGDTITSKK